MRSLSFVSRAIDPGTGKPERLWEVDECGDWSADNEKGRSMAAECIEYMQQHESPGFLLHVVKSIAEAGRFGGIETGFFHAIALHTTA